MFNVTLKDASSPSICLDKGSKLLLSNVSAKSLNCIHNNGANTIFQVKALSQVKKAE